MSLSATATKKSGRATVAFGTVIALVIAMLAIAWSAGSLPARAAGALVCNSTTIYGVVPDNPAVFNTNTNLLQVNGTSVGNAQLSAFLVSRSPVDNVNQNALAISADGNDAYASADQGTTIRRWDGTTDVWTSYPGRPLLDPGDTALAGAVDPTTGIYYFGDVGGTPSSPNFGELYGFDTATNTLISTTPLLTFPAIPGESNGDIAFDGAGNLYIVMSSVTTGDLKAIPGPLPQTVAQARLIPPTPLSTFAVPASAGAAVNGIAFDANGTLYLSLAGAAGGVFTIDPGTGSPQSTLTPLSPALIGPSSAGFVDLASCAYPPSVSVQKNVVSRVNPTDQFTLSATGPTISLPATATTVGTANGLQTTAGGQTLQAGPGLARFGDIYTATETAAGTTDLSQYESTYSCVDTANATNPQFPITGTGTSVSFTLAPSSGEAPAVVCTFTNAPVTASLALTKTANPTTVTAAGQTVVYTFEVTNTGNTTLTGIGITETVFTGTGTLPTPTCVATTLAPAATTQCTTTYTTTAADLGATTIDNTAVATGQDPATGTVTSPDASAQVTVTPAVAALDLTKTANPATVTAAGDTITYTFHVTNTGNVPIDSIAIQEGTFSGTGSLTAITCNATTLAPAASTDCTATYQATQADIDAGQITNDATATGDDPAGDPITSPTADATVTATAAPALTLTKTVSPTSGTTPGDTITYSFLIENTGNTTITNPTAAEVTFTGTGTAPVIDCPPGVILAPGDSTICTAPYTLTQADVDAGQINNTATATGTDPTGGTVTSNDSDVTLPIPSTPALTLTKSANPTAIVNAGDTITYTFDVTNSGNVTATAIGITETAFSGTGTLSPITCNATTLAPAATTQCTATYQATAADIAAGIIDNTAEATGTDPGNNTITSPPSTATVTAVNAALDLTKTANPATVTAAGDTITYTFHVTNTGNVPIDSIAIQEGTFSGTGSLTAITCNATTLAPAASTDCTATYQATQADIDAGQITNDATATGDDPAGDPITSPTADATVTATATPALTLTKTVSPTSGTTPGDTITYSFLIENTGNTTITNIGVAEGAFTGTGGSPAITCPAGASSLAPGDSLICTAQYELTQADADAGQIDNTATASGTDTTGGTVTSNDSDVTLPIPPTPALTLLKTANTDTIDGAGQTITYSFRVTNTGNVTITDLAVVEQSFSGTGTPLTLNCPADTTLVAGQSLTCTADYQATAADFAAGTITNTADATGIDPSTATVTAPESRAVVKSAAVVTPPASPAPPATDDSLAKTGGTFPGWLAPLAGLLALAGIGLTIMVTSRNRARKQGQ